MATPYNYFGGGTGFYPPSMPPGQQYTGGNPFLQPQPQPLPAQQGGFMPQPVQKPMQPMPWQPQPPVTTLPYQIPNNPAPYNPYPNQNPSWGAPAGGSLMGTLVQNQMQQNQLPQLQGLLGRMMGPPGAGAASPGMFLGGPNPFAGPSGGQTGYAMPGRAGPGLGAVMPGISYNPVGGGRNYGPPQTMPGRMYAGGSPTFNENARPGMSSFANLYGRGLRY